VKLALQLRLLPDVERAAKLKATVEAFNAACDWLAGEAFDLKLANKVKLQQIFYRDLRCRFGLSAQMAIRCIAQVVGSYRRDKAKRPRFRKHAAMPYDERIMSFKGVDRVYLLTLQERVIVPFVMGKYQRERFALAKGQSDLVLRKDGRWFLLVTADVPEKTPIPHTDFIGIDLGVANLATTSDGGRFGGEKVESVRQGYHVRRQTLQHAAARRKAKGRRPKAIRRALRRTGGRESNFRRDINHVISKQLVTLATDTGRGIALEELTHIRSRTRFRRSQRAKMAGWAFLQLRAFIAYKAQLAGVQLAIVDPRDTSRTCSVCGHCEKANRQSQSEFCCQSCGHIANADINAALNIRARALSTGFKVSEQRLVA
jgi:IS605 OrfB family transposase